MNLSFNINWRYHWTLHSSQLARRSGIDTLQNIMQRTGIPIANVAEQSFHRRRGIFPFPVSDDILFATTACWTTMSYSVTSTRAFWTTISCVTTSLFDEEGLVDEGGRTADQKAQSLNILPSKLERSNSVPDGDDASVMVNHLVSSKWNETKSNSTVASCFVCWPLVTSKIKWSQEQQSAL